MVTELSVALQSGCQFSGRGAVLGFAPSVVRAAGTSTEGAQGDDDGLRDTVKGGPPCWPVAPTEVRQRGC